MFFSSRLKIVRGSPVLKYSTEKKEKIFLIIEPNRTYHSRREHSNVDKTPIMKSSVAQNMQHAGVGAARRANQLTGL